MSKIIFLLALFFGFLFMYPQVYGQIKAQTIEITPTSFTNKDKGGLDIIISGLRPGILYDVAARRNNATRDYPIGGIAGIFKYGFFDSRVISYFWSADSSGSIKFHICPRDLGNPGSDIVATNNCGNDFFPEGIYYITVFEATVWGHKYIAQNFFKVDIQSEGVITCANANDKFTSKDPIIINVSGLTDRSYNILVDGNKPASAGLAGWCIDVKGGKIENADLGTYYDTPSPHTISLYTNIQQRFTGSCGSGSLVNQLTFYIDSKTGGHCGTAGAKNTVPKLLIECNKPGVICGGSKGKEVAGCNNATVPDPKEPSKKIPNPNPGIATAIGCIHTNPAEFTKDLLKFVIAIGGGLAFLMMLLGAFQMLTSAGNPESLNAGKERLTSAVIGLLFVIFAILLMQIIGIDILKIPGFGK